MAPMMCRRDRRQPPPGRSPKTWRLSRATSPPAYPAYRQRYHHRPARRQQPVNTFQARTHASSAGDNNYGTFTLDAAGNWTYTARQFSQTAIQQPSARRTSRSPDSFTKHVSAGRHRPARSSTSPFTAPTTCRRDRRNLSTGSVTEDVAASPTPPAGNLDHQRHAHHRRRRSGPVNTFVPARPPATAGSNYGTHLHARCGGQLDLHRRRRPDRDPAARRRAVDHRQLHRRLARRHRQPAGDGDHQRHQRRAGDRWRLHRGGHRRRGGCCRQPRAPAARWYHRRRR